jgi:hypothetical protein
MPGYEGHGEPCFSTAVQGRIPGETPKRPVSATQNLMAFYARQDLGRIYVLKITLMDHQVIHKIGICHSPRSVDRMMEVLRSWFQYHRYVPMTELRLDMPCNSPGKVEKYLHEILYDYRFDPGKNTDGYTELFTGVNEVRLLTFIRSYLGGYHILPPELSVEEYRIIGKLLCH